MDFMRGTDGDLDYCIIGEVKEGLAFGVKPLLVPTQEEDELKLYLGVRLRFGVKDYTQTELHVNAEDVVKSLDLPITWSKADAIRCSTHYGYLIPFPPKEILDIGTLAESLKSIGALRTLAQRMLQLVQSDEGVSSVVTDTELSDYIYTVIAKDAAAIQAVLQEMAAYQDVDIDELVADPTPFTKTVH